VLMLQQQNASCNGWQGPANTRQAHSSHRNAVLQQGQLPASNGVQLMVQKQRHAGSSDSKAEALTRSRSISWSVSSCAMLQLANFLSGLSEQNLCGGGASSQPETARRCGAQKNANAAGAAQSECARAHTIRRRLPSHPQRAWARGATWNTGHIGSSCPCPRPLVGRSLLRAQNVGVQAEAREIEPLPHQPLFTQQQRSLSVSKTTPA